MNNNRSRSKKKDKKKKNRSSAFEEIRYKKTDGEAYGYIERNNGANFLVNTLNNKEINCTLSGKVKNSFKVNQGDLVLLETNNNNKGTIVFLYNKKQIKRLLE